MRATPPQAARLSGCTPRQLAVWARVGLVEPAGDGSYGFRDLVALRVVSSMLEAGLSLAKVKDAIRYLVDSGEDIAGLRIVTDGNKLWACRDDGQILDALRHGQLALFVALDRYVDDVRTEIAAFDAERDAFVAGLEPEQAEIASDAISGEPSTGAANAS